jgi:hypothetical protein
MAVQQQQQQQRLALRCIDMRLARISRVMFVAEQQAAMDLWQGSMVELGYNYVLGMDWDM